MPSVCEGTPRRQHDNDDRTIRPRQNSRHAGGDHGDEEAGESPLKLLKRHAHGDFGNPHPFDVDANELAIRREMRLLSAYVLSTGERVSIITEADRSAITIKGGLGVQREDSQ